MKSIKEELINKISQNSIVIFVGAGLSINAGFPSWRALVESILDGLAPKEPKSGKYKQALKDDLFTPVEVLSKISYLREASIEILEKHIRHLDGKSPLSSHFKLGEISNNIITTNYDNLLEKALPEYEQIVYSNEYKVAKLSQYSKYIFKIHGDIHEPNKCILFPTEYDKLYTLDEKTSTFELKKIISDKSILFIGFSLTDPYINNVFDFINKLYSGFNPDHFVITTDENKNWPKKINPIFIENHDQLSSLLDDLIEGKQKVEAQQRNLKKEIEEESKTGIVNISKGHDYDSPPINRVWVGREREIENINNGIFKAIFITGIGGQGKSALAAHYIRNYFDSNIYEFADWRDFKEEVNRFHTKLISIIRRLSPEAENFDFEHIANNSLVDTFFHALKDRKIIFVFDNVDSYIGLESFKPEGSFGYFFEQILSRNHKSKFIFTCRPFIREAGVEFYQITLKGISKEESLELFRLYQIPLNDDDLLNLIERAHKLTKGHPLWLNLIAGQAIRGVNTVKEFMTEIEGKTSFSEDNFSSILSEKILSVVWKSLNDKQKNLIRAVSETVKPETEENLKIILDSELNSNQFTRSLRTLKNLNLIETLKEGEIELHPLVKEYVLTKYPKNERAKFITLFVKYYDKFIYILKPNLNSKLSIQEFQNWTLKIELQINKNDFKSALIALSEVSTAILAAGYSDEYLRVASKLYQAINWELAIGEEYDYFHPQLGNLTTTLTQMGHFNEVESILNKYVKLIPGKSANYLGYCSEKVYSYWYQGEYDKAIQIGEEGVALLEESSLADNYALKHNMALAYRDSKLKPNVEKALKYFSRNEDISNLLNNYENNKEFAGAYYGNLGKCLEYLNREQDALKCFYISLKLLIQEEDSTNSKLNIGYASSWIADSLIKTGDNYNALFFLKYARNCWDKISPPRLIKVTDKWQSVSSEETIKAKIDQTSEWKIQSHCLQFIADKLL